MKRKNSLGLFSGIALGLASIYALTVYFGLTSVELKGFMLSALLLLAAMLVVAVMLVVILKVIAKLLMKWRGGPHESDNDQE